MDEYTKLKTKIESYLNMPEVELTQEIVSVYMLNKILNHGLERLRNVKLGDSLKDEVNRGRTIVEKVGRVFKKKGICSHVMTSCDEKTARITFCFITPESRTGSKYLKVYRDVNSDQIYFDRHGSDKSFVEKHYDSINEYFDILEEYNALYTSGIDGKDINQIFTDGFFIIDIICTTFGKVEMITTLNEEIDKERIFTREWFQRQTLQDFYHEHEDEILKRIPINISGLNYTMQTLVRDAASKQNIPILVKTK